MSEYFIMIREADLLYKEAEIDRLRSELARFDKFAEKANEHGFDSIASAVAFAFVAEAELAAMCENHQAAVAHYRKRDTELAAKDARLAQWAEGLIAEKEYAALRKELAEAKAWNNNARDVHDGMLSVRHELERELAEAKAVLESWRTGVDGVNLRAESAEARLVYYEGLHNEAYSAMLARAERAEARVTECLEANGALINSKDEMERCWKEAHTRVMELERHLENAGVYGNAGRYWEGRWRDEHTGSAALVARIAELVAANGDLAMIALKHQETARDDNARAERAEAECTRLQENLTGVGCANSDLYKSFERADAECKAMREALQWIETKARLAHNVNHVEVYAIHRGIADKARAALNPSPADQEG